MNCVYIFADSAGALNEQNTNGSACYLFILRGCESPGACEGRYFPLID